MVFQYVKENKHKAFIDADTLVDSLRHQYPEYSRRQRTAVKYLAGRGKYFYISLRVQHLTEFFFF